MTKSNDLSEKVSKTLDKVRPYLQADGGDVSLIEVTDENIVKVQLKGACGCCPFSLQTLKSGIEMAIKQEVPEIKEVVAV